MGMKNMEPPEGKRFYGSVTVGERGQIVIPSDARKDYCIKAGDKLLVFGDLGQGLWIATMANIQKLMDASPKLSKMFAATMGGKKNQRRYGSHSSRKNRQARSADEHSNKY